MNKSILSVNGSKAINYLLQTIFENEYRFLCTSDVFQGMHKLKNDNSIGVLIVDVDFQPQQSWQLIRYIKSSRLYSIPVIVLATENSNEIKQKSYESEISEIFFKPFNPIDLMAVIKNVLTPSVLSPFKTY